jgi:hypothetical protein
MKKIMSNLLCALCAWAPLRSHAQATNSPPTTNAPSLTLAWTPSATTNEGPLSYAVWWGTNTGDYFTNAAAGANTQLSLSNLSRGVTYYCAVTATATNGLTSAYSAEATYAAIAIPAPPTAVRVIVISP